MTDSWCYQLTSTSVLFMYLGEAEVLTEVQAGPLYRVVGTLLSISCNVSGSTNENAEKQFEFSIRKPAKPGVDINIISTKDDAFAYAVYSKRVRNKEITVKRVSPNSVRLELQMLQKDDEGECHCTVVNIERNYQGTINANTTVKGNQSPFLNHVLYIAKCITSMSLCLFLP